MSTEAQKLASKRYNQKNLRSFLIQLNKETDQDLIAFLFSGNFAPGSRTRYIKRLIREDMAKQQDKGQ